MNLTPKQHRLLLLALRWSMESDYHRIKIGAVVAKGSKYYNHGYNLIRPCGIQASYNKRVGRITKSDCRHAEMDVLCKARACGRSAKGMDMYVARLDRNGMPAMCKPCPACELAIREAGIKRVFYTTPTGVEVLNVS